MSIFKRLSLFIATLASAFVFVFLLSILAGGCTTTKTKVAMMCFDKYDQPVYIGMAKDIDSDVLVQTYIKFGIICAGFPEEVLERAKSAPMPAPTPTPEPQQSASNG